MMNYVLKMMNSLLKMTDLQSYGHHHKKRLIEAKAMERERVSKNDEFCINNEKELCFKLMNFVLKLMNFVQDKDARLARERKAAARQAEKDMQQIHRATAQAAAAAAAAGGGGGSAEQPRAVVTTAPGGSVGGLKLGGLGWKSKRGGKTKHDDSSKENDDSSKENDDSSLEHEILHLKTRMFVTAHRSKGLGRGRGRAAAAYVV